MTLTKEQIEDMRSSLGKGAQPFTKDAIDSLCALAVKALQPEAPFPTDRAQAALWRDLVLLDPMDLMVIYGGAENDVVLLGKLKAFIEAKRREPQLHRRREQAMKAYTVHEIDALRQACEQRWLFGSNRISGGTSVSRQFREEEKVAAVESMVRTYMIAGITADDLWKADNP